MVVFFAGAVCRHNPRGGTCTSGSRVLSASPRSRGAACGHRWPTALATPVIVLGAAANRGSARRPVRPRRRRGGGAQRAAHPGDQHWVVQPAQGQAVAGRHQVQRAAHEQHPHRRPLLEQVREVGGHEVVQPGPDADVGLLRFLRLEPHEVLDEVQRGSAGTGEQVLAGEQGPVERAGVQHRPVRHRRHHDIAARSRSRGCSSPCKGEQPARSRSPVPDVALPEGREAGVCARPTGASRNRREDVR